MTEIKNTMSLKDFVESGFLQEVNRKFFHPMGIALSVTADKKGIFQGFGPILDYRDHPHGILFKEIDPEMILKAQTVENHRYKTAKIRFRQLGYITQPLEKNTVHIWGRFEGNMDDERTPWSICGIFNSNGLKEAIGLCQTEKDFIMVDFPVNKTWPDPSYKIEEFSNTIYPLIDFPNTDSETIVNAFENRSDQHMTFREFIDNCASF